MNGPPRLLQGGGQMQRLLESASLDRPSAGSRSAALGLAATSAAFARSSSEARRPPPASLGRTLAKWVAIGAAAGGILALGASQLLSSSQGGAAASPSGYVLTELPAASALPPVARPSDISPEPAQVRPKPSSHNLAVPKAPAPAGSIEPWVPSPVEAAATPPAPGKPLPSSAAFAEAREIEAAREAVSRGDESAAIATLNKYEQAHPNGTLAPEAMALRIQALSNSGKVGEARTLAGEFQAKYPRHPLSGQIKAGTNGIVVTPK